MQIKYIEKTNLQITIDKYLIARSRLCTKIKKMAGYFEDES